VEASKFCIPTKAAGRLLHPIHGQRLTDPPDKGLAKGGPAGGDLVPIAALDGVVPRVKFTRCLEDRADVDVGGQFVVQLAT